MHPDPITLARTYPDADQAAHLNRPPTTLTYDRRTRRVLTGPFRGLLADQVYEQIEQGQLKRGKRGKPRTRLTHPWWRLGRSTWVMTIEVW